MTDKESKVAGGVDWMRAPHHIFPLQAREAGECKQVSIKARTFWKACSPRVVVGGAWAALQPENNFNVPEHMDWGEGRGAAEDTCVDCVF